MHRCMYVYIYVYVEAFLFVICFRRGCRSNIHNLIHPGPRLQALGPGSGVAPLGPGPQDPGPGPGPRAWAPSWGSGPLSVGSASRRLPQAPGPGPLRPRAPQTLGRELRPGSCAPNYEVKVFLTFLLMDTNEKLLYICIFPKQLCCKGFV